MVFIWLEWVQLGRFLMIQMKMKKLEDGGLLFFSKNYNIKGIGIKLSRNKLPAPSFLTSSFIFYL